MEGLLAALCVDLVPFSLHHQTEARMGCLLTAVSSAGDPAADPDTAPRSERWTAGPLALRRKHYLKRVSTQVSTCGPG